MAAVDAAVASALPTPDNLFVTGGSGGGILTAWIVGKTDRFRGGSAEAGDQLVNLVLTSDNVPFFGRYWMGSRCRGRITSPAPGRSPLTVGPQKGQYPQARRRGRQRGLPHPG